MDSSWLQNISRGDFYIIPFQYKGSKSYTDFPLKVVGWTQTFTSFLPTPLLNQEQTYKEKAERENSNKILKGEWHTIADLRKLNPKLSMGMVKKIWLTPPKFLVFSGICDAE